MIERIILRFSPFNKNKSPIPDSGHHLCIEIPMNSTNQDTQNLVKYVMSVILKALISPPGCANEVS